MKYACAIQIIQATIKKNIVYKFSHLSTVTGILFSMFIQLFLWKALLPEGATYQNNGEISFSTMTAYVFISSLLQILTTSYLLDNTSSKIRKGDIVFNLLRPRGLFFITLCESIGEGAYKLLFIVVPIGCLFGILFDIHLPDATSLLLFIISTINAFFLVFILEYLVSLAGFWIVQTHSLGVFFWSIFSLLSGAMVPIWFFPDWLQGLANCLPFNFVYFFPISVFTGEINIATCCQGVVAQIAWIVVLNLLAHFVFKRGLRKIVIFGG